jgi:putative transcriptional regulator
MGWSDFPSPLAGEALRQSLRRDPQSGEGEGFVAASEKTQRDAVAHAKGNKTAARVHRIKVADLDVRALRKKLGMSQDIFATTFKFSSATVRSWEQKRRRPEGPAKVLLTIIAKEPAAVKRALSG